MGRQIKCIYTYQPEYQEQLEKQRRQREQRYNDLANDDSDTRSNTNFESEHSENDSDVLTQEKKNQFLENLLAVSLILIFVYFHQSLSEE